MRYFDGVVELGKTDVYSDGFGMEWGLDRSWTNGAGYATSTFSGSGMVVSELPYIMQDGTANHVAVITNGIDSRDFDLSGGVYSPRFYQQEGLAHDLPNSQFVLTDTTGQVLRFWDFSTGLPVNERGQFQSLADPAGNVTQVTSRTTDGKPAEVQRTATSAGQTVTESFQYSYLTSGPDTGLMSGVTLRRQVNGGAWTVTRQSVLSYYDGTQSFGNVGDLQLASITDGAGHTLDTTYYRYYSGEAGGYSHALKYVIGPESYARLAAALGNPLTLSDSQISGYADRFFQYAKWAPPFRLTPGKGFFADEQSGPRIGFEPTTRGLTAAC